MTPPDPTDATAETVSSEMADTLDHAPTGLAESDGSLTVTREQPGRYRPPGPDPSESELGRGGIGRVLVVRDAHLGRDVALKELLSAARPGGSASGRAGSGRDALVQTRFVREARITGQLEHPNIVPVYELGQRTDGTLYYTMKVVRGRTLADALAACDGLGARLELLKHYADLCNAMAYAHARGVIHRDLKPGNVMLGAFGETVVLDWGLARPVQGVDPVAEAPIEDHVDAADPPDAAATVEGSILGTPLYMSPEQAHGRADLGPAADVWSLGVILYELLTGERPFTGKSAVAVLSAVVSGPLRPVREVCPDAPPELAAIAERALARDLDARYADAGELAAEVGAFLVGGRVRAYRYGLRDVLARFARRYKVALAVAGAAAALLLALGVWAHLAVRAEMQRAVAAEDEATRAAETARAAEAAAVTARDEAEGLVQFMVGDLRENLEPLGRLDLMDRVLERVREHVEAAPAPADPLADPARTRSRAGMQYLIARLEAARGRTESATAAAEEAHRLRAALADHTGEAEDALALARSALQRAALDRQRGDRPAAERQVRAALDGLIPRATPGADPELVLARSEAHVALGDLLGTGGDLAAAEAAYDEALALRRGLVEREPTEPRWQEALGEAHDRIGDARFEQGDLAGARAAYGEAMALRAALVERHPDNLGWVRKLGVSHDQLGDVRFEMGDGAGALAEFEAAMGLLTRAYVANPSHVGWRRDAAIGRLKVTDAMAAIGRSAAAERGLRSVIEDLEKLVAHSRADVGWVRDLTVARWRRADLLIELDRLDEAAALLEAAQADAARIAEAVPGNALYRHDLALGHVKRGDLAVRRGDAVTAAVAYRTAGRVLGRLAQADARNVLVARDRATAVRRLEAVLGRPDLDRAALWAAVRAADAREAAPQIGAGGGGAPAAPARPAIGFRGRDTPPAAAAPAAEAPTERAPRALLDDPLLRIPADDLAPSDLRPWVGAGDRAAPRIRPGRPGAEAEAADDTPDPRIGPAEEAPAAAPPPDADPRIGPADSEAKREFEEATPDPREARPRIEPARQRRPMPRIDPGADRGAAPPAPEPVVPGQP